MQVSFHHQKILNYSKHS